MSLLYQKRRLKVNKIKRQISSRQATFHRLRAFAAFLACIGIICFSYWILKLPQWYINSKKLNSADKTVLAIQGNSITPDYKIINIIRQIQLPYTQIFRLNTKELEENIMQLQTIKKVFIRKYWFPARLVISLEERNIAFLLAPNLETTPMSAMTTDGILLDSEYFPFKSQLKTKKLLTYGIKDGHEEVWNKEKVDEILSLVKMVEGYSNQEVKYVDLRNTNDIYIMLDEFLIRLGEFNDTADKRLKWIATILPEAKKIQQKIKYIDLRWDDSRYFRLEGAKEIESRTSLKANSAKANNEKKVADKNLQEDIQNKQTQQETLQETPTAQNEMQIQQQTQNEDELD